MLCSVQNRVIQRGQTSSPAESSRLLLLTITMGFLNVTVIQVLFAVSAVGFFHLPRPKGPMAKQNWLLH